MFHGLLCHNLYPALSKEYVVFSVVCVFHRVMCVLIKLFCAYMMHYNHKVKLLYCGPSFFPFLHSKSRSHIYLGLHPVSRGLT
jgi:hypothetical protein